MRILITNVTFAELSGTVTFARDLALELRRQGHEPAIFSKPGRGIGADLRAAGIPVSQRLASLPRPDVVHGHHRPVLLSALHRWPGVPAIWVCHDHRSVFDATPHHPSVRRYFGVSRVCVGRIVGDGVPAGEVELLPNFVDTARFVRRAPLSERPARALVFSNYASPSTHLPAVREACRRQGLELDVVGAAAGRVAERPEDLLGRYDLVFAKGRAAIEALCAGAAVLLCDAAGAGPMVSTRNVDALRSMNFGYEALTHPLSADVIADAIREYDKADASRASGMLRSMAGVEAAVRRLVDVYAGVVRTHGNLSSRSAGGQASSAWKERFQVRLLWAWWSTPLSLRQTLRPLIRPVARRTLGVP